MTDAWRVRFAGALVALVFALEVAAVALTAGLGSLTEPVLYFAYAVIQAAAGALVVHRFPRHRVGWVLLGSAVVNAVFGDFALAYGIRAAADGWPFGPLGELLGMVSWIAAACGLILLFLLFPDGHLSDRRWRWVLWSWAAGAALALPGWALNPRLDGDFAAGTNPFAVPGVPAEPLFALGAALVSGALVASVVALLRRLRRATGPERDQLKWVAASAAVVGLVLPTSAALWTVWEPIRLLSAIALVLLPVSASVAILRHRLYDVDRLIARTAAYLVLALLLGGAYVALVAAIATITTSPVAAAIGAVVVALTFRPVHDRVQDLADRVLLRDRFRARSIMTSCVESLRRGEATDSDIVAAFRRAVGDEGLTLEFLRPDGTSVDPNGTPVAIDADDSRELLTAPIAAGGSVVIAHRPGAARLVGVVLDAGRLAVEITALQLQLRRQLTELSESRARIQGAADGERRRLARDLHDGAQQRLVAVGLALRHSQHQLGGENPAVSDSIDAAVSELSASIDELRELAGGLRPSSLDGGLDGALHELAARSPLPMQVSVEVDRLPTHLEAAAYFFVCEAVTQCGQARGGERDRGVDRPRQRVSAGEGCRRRHGRRPTEPRNGPDRSQRPGPRTPRNDDPDLAARRGHRPGSPAAMRVILAEDQVLLREGLARLFADHGHEVVASVGDVGDLEATVAELRPDLLVLDIRMPPTHTDEGATAARTIKARWPDLGVLLLSQHVETSLTLDLLALPGFGYLLKDRVLDVAEFDAAALRVASGGSAIDPKVVAALIDAHRTQLPLDRLSAREREVLERMAEGLSNGAIAERLSLSARTVEAHVGHVLNKLDIPESNDAHRRVLAVLAWLRSRP